MQTELFEGGGLATVGIREFAREVGVSAPAIVAAIDEGKITAVLQAPGGRKLYYARALEEWRAVHPAEGTRREESEYGRKKLEMLELDLEDKRMEMARKRGELLPADAVKRAWGEMVASCRSRILNLQDKLIAQLPGDPLELGRIIEPLVHEALREMAEYEPRKSRQSKKRA